MGHGPLRYDNIQEEMFCLLKLILQVNASQHMCWRRQRKSEMLHKHCSPAMHDKKKKKNSKMKLQNYSKIKLQNVLIALRIHRPSLHVVKVASIII